MNAWEAGLAGPLFEFLKNPADVKPIQEMYRCFSKDVKVQKAVERKVLSDERFRALYESWYMPEPYTLERLGELPKESFGYIYATHMQKNGLQLNFIDKFDGRDVLSYLWCRAGHVHDIMHVITGYDTSFLGELGLKGFELAQFQSASTAAVLGGGLLAVTSIQPENVGVMFDKIVEGYLLGKKFPFLMGITWDKEWETPITDLRQKFGIPQGVGSQA